MIAAEAAPKTRVGENITKLRKECGWGTTKLVAKMGIDKKLVLSHMRGTSMPRAQTLAEYAQAFSKQLNRPITANDLEA